MMASTSKTYGSIESDSSDLSNKVANDLLIIKRNAQQLDKLKRIIGSDRDNHALRNQVFTLQKDTNERIKIVTADINRMRALLKSGDKLDQRRLSKRAGDFKEMLQKFSDCRTAINVKMKQNVLANVIVEVEEKKDENSILNTEQQQLVDTTQFQIEQLERREQKMRQLEEDMVDLKVIMQDMAALTMEQGEKVTEIDNSVENTLSNLEEGTSNLQKASRYTVQHRRWLLFIVIGVICLIILIYLLAK